MDKIYIGIAGKAGAGKSTVAKGIQELMDEAGYSCEIIRFIGVVKDLMKKCYNLTDEQLDSQEGKEIMLAPGLTVRQAIDKIGKVLRSIDKDCMANAWRFQASESKAQIIIADDVRFDVEALAILAAGGKVIRLTRCNSVPYKSESESSLPEILITNVVDNRELNISQTVMAVMLWAINFDLLQTDEDAANG